MLGEEGKAGTLPGGEEKKLVGHEDIGLLGEASADKVRELEDKLLRLAADFDNYKKRAAKENDMLKDQAVGQTLLKMLPIVDDFEIAMTHMEHVKDKEFKHGFELIYAKLRDLLRREGVEEIQAMGEMFDPYRHEAIRYERGKEGRIIEVVQKGYTLKGKVLRFAKVIVGKEGEG